VFVGVLAIRYNRFFSKDPHYLFQNNATAQSK